MSFEANTPPHTLQTQFQLEDMGLFNSGNMEKSELPSIQLFEMQQFGGPEVERDGVIQHGNSSSGYLDDIFKEAQATVGIQALRRVDMEENLMEDGFEPWFSNSSSGDHALRYGGGEWHDSGSVHSSAGEL